MWTRVAFVALAFGVVDGVLVAMVVRASAARRGAPASRMEPPRVSETEDRPRVVPDLVAVRATDFFDSPPADVALLDPPQSRGRDHEAPSEIRGGARVMLFDLLVGTVALGVLWCISGVISIAVLDLDMFGLIHLLWFAIFAGLPVAAAILLWGIRRERRAPIDRVRARRPSRASVPAAVLLVAALLLAPVAVYGSVIEPDRLDTEVISGVTLPPGRAGSSPLRVGVVSDIQARHIGPHELEAVDRMMSLQPDLVLVAGDIFQEPAAYDAELPAIRSLLGRLRAPGGVYLAQGDCDPPATLLPMIEGTAVRLLRDQTVHTKVRDREVTIGGLDIDVRSDAATKVIQGLQNTPGDSDIRILMSHRPDSVLRLSPGTRVDLVAAGHTHGGQVVLPGFGPPLTLSSVPRHVAAGGFHDLDGRRIYITKGVGMERGQAPQVRLNAVPNIGLVELV